MRAVQVVEAFLAIVHNMVMLIGIVYIAQFVTGIFNWPGRQNNVIYRLFGFLLSPVTKAVRAITPAKIADKHVPVVAFALLFWLYVILIAARLYVKRPELFQ
jgi:TctA family transporter